VNSRGAAERVLLSRSGVATPALFRFAGTWRGGAAEHRAWPSTFLITGAARKQPPGCFILSEALRGRELFLPFSFRRRKAIGVAASKTPPDRRGALRGIEEKKGPRPHPHPPVEATDTRTPCSAYAHVHARAIARASANAPRFRYVLLLAVGPI